MGVKVRERKPGEWWVFVNHKGRRKAKKVGKPVAKVTNSNREMANRLDQRDESATYPQPEAIAISQDASN